MSKKLAASMLNLSLQTDDPQRIKAIVMDAMALMGMEKTITLPEPRQPSYEEVRIKQAMHNRNLRSVHGPL